MNDLKALFAAAAEAKRIKKIEEEKTPAGQALKAVQERLKTNNDIAELMEVFVEKKQHVKEIVVEKIVEKEVIVEVETPVTNTDSFQQPAPQPVDPNFTALIKKVQFLEQAIGKIAAAGPGGGEVNLRWLDDVDRGTIQDNRYLRYSAASKKFIFDDVDAVGDYATITETTTITILPHIHNLILLNTTNGSRNITVQDMSKIVFSKDGTYNITYSLQTVNSDTIQQDITIFLKKNGANVPDSSSIFTIPARKSANVYGKVVACSPTPVDVLAGDYVEIYAHTDDSTTITIQSLDEDPTHNIPRSPSVIVVVQKL